MTANRGSEPGSSRVVVAEGAQGHVLRAVHLQGDGPGLLVLPQRQGVIVLGNLFDAGLGIVGGDLAAHHLVVLAADHQGYAIAVSGQFQ